MGWGSRFMGFGLGAVAGGIAVWCALTARPPEPPASAARSIPAPVAAPTAADDAEPELTPAEQLAEQQRLDQDLREARELLRRIQAEEEARRVREEARRRIEDEFAPFRRKRKPPTLDPTAPKPPQPGFPIDGPGYAPLGAGGCAAGSSSTEQPIPDVEQERDRAAAIKSLQVDLIRQEERVRELELSILLMGREFADAAGITQDYREAIRRRDAIRSELEALERG